MFSDTAINNCYYNNNEKLMNITDAYCIKINKKGLTETRICDKF